jgi:hypothetical protein
MERPGEWVSEKRRLWDDYRRAIGTPPAAIVVVWLIGVGIFTDATAYCEYSALKLTTDDRIILLI